MSDIRPIIGSDRDAIAEWFHRHTEGMDERVCYHYNQYKWDCREMADDLIESLPKSDISSDPVGPFVAEAARRRLSEQVPVDGTCKCGHHVTSHDGRCSAACNCTGYDRDTSSDPGRDFARWFLTQPLYRQQKFIKEWHRQHPRVRDISSVTGSEAQSFLADLGTDSEFVRRDRYAARLAAIQREAVDAFIRDDLCGLLTRAMPDAHEDVPPEVAAKIAELRDE